MPKLPKLTSQEADKLLTKAGFTLIRIKGSHKIYEKQNYKVAVPHHSGKILHPKIIKQVLTVIELSQ